MMKISIENKKTYEDGVRDERQRIENIIDELIKEAAKPLEGDLANMLSQSILSTMELKILFHIREKTVGLDLEKLQKYKNGVI